MKGEYRRIPLPPFHSTHIGSVDASLIPQRLLRQACLLSRAPSTRRLVAPDDGGLVPIAHQPCVRLACMMTMSLQTISIAFTKTLREAVVLGNCRTCKGTVSYEAEACPHCGAPNPVVAEPTPPAPADPKRLDAVAAVVGTGLVVSTIALLAWLWSDPQPGQPDPPSYEDRQITAWVACKMAVERRLKAPTTADFETGGHLGVFVSGESFAVESYVDAENSFGAMLRNSFSCSGTTDGKTARVVRVDLDSP